MTAASRANVDSFIVMEVMNQAAKLEKAGHSIIHMEVGQPGTSAPQPARKAAAEALGQDPLGYTVAAGLPELRQRIAQHYANQYGVNVDAERIIVTTGSSAGFVLTFLAVFEAGTKVGLPVPGYPCYRQILKALGQTEVPIRTDAASRWMPTVEAIAQAKAEHDIAGVLIASPANPTGTMLSPERLDDICQYCRVNGLWFISDEIYHGLTYGRDAVTALGNSNTTANENVVIINSFSKYFSMTGWRIGWVVVPTQLIGTFERLQQNLYISPPTISQVAALAAFDGTEELEANRSVYAHNREILLQGLKDTGFSKSVPADGAFYLYCDVSDWCSDSLALSTQVLHEAHVAITPGIDFDKHEGHRYVRFSYARSTADIEKGILRLQHWWASQTART
ncbi:MAG: aminotransferase class I/II-fold pyridoxal phosphate-dependent enzyme [Pseudomonadota bacterium]